MDRVCPTLIHFSQHEQKLTKFNQYLMFFTGHFNNYLKSFGLFDETYKISPNFFIHFQCTLSTFAFAFGAFES
jgi:hypothetical protein